ncbi:MAG: hypothetical protein KAH32_03815 [Chlamydiia bacterium]|nr:hypothetical protein [Chlamydiia bacterium]
MGVYKGTFILGGGFEVNAGIPIDDRVDVLRLSDIIYAIEKEDFFLKMYAGQIFKIFEPEVFGSDRVYAVSKFVNYIWRESMYGAIEDGFLYKVAIGDYLGKTFNLCVLSDSVNVATTLDATTSDILIPKKLVPIHVLDGKVANIMIQEDGDTEFSMPNSVKFEGDYMKINVKPAYTVGTFLNIKIS